MVEQMTSIWSAVCLTLHDPVCTVQDDLSACDQLSHCPVTYGKFCLNNNCQPIANVFSHREHVSAGALSNWTKFSIKLGRCSDRAAYAAADSRPHNQSTAWSTCPLHIPPPPPVNSTTERNSASNWGTAQIEQRAPTAAHIINQQPGQPVPSTYHHHQSTAQLWYTDTNQRYQYWDRSAHEGCHAFGWQTLRKSACHRWSAPSDELLDYSTKTYLAPYQKLRCIACELHKFFIRVSRWVRGQRVPHHSGANKQIDI